MSEPRVVHVDIQGQRYAIKSSLDAKYVNDIAAFVDQKMERVGRELSTTDTGRIAVLAALNIADELFRMRQDSSGETARLIARAEDIERIIDAALSSDAIAGTRAAR